MRVLVIDAEAGRAALVAEGLAGFAPLEIRQAHAYDEAQVQAFAPDVVVVAAERLDLEMIARLQAASLADPRPVAMFVDRSDPGLAEAAVRAGVAAYVVDGLAPGRVRGVLEVAMARFQLTRQLRRDLEKARADLAARKAVDRAKALLMKERGLEEATAYRLLRKLSMDTGRPLGVVAADLLAFAGVLKGDGA
jgi:response regulator NasT